MKTGRPTNFTPDTIAKLEHAFLLGCSDLEACFYAKVGKTALYNYQNKNPEFVERKAQLKQNPYFIARSSIIKGMEENPELALKYMERKKKDEFSTKTHTDHSGSIGLTNILEDIDGTSANLPSDKE